MGKTLGEMTPAERGAAVRRTVTRFQAELTATAPLIAAVLDDDEPAPAAVGFYASIERGTRHGLLLGPYATQAEAESHVDDARRLAGEVDSFTAFDSFGVTRVEARPGHDLPACLLARIPAYADGTPVKAGDTIRYRQAPGGLMARSEEWRYGTAVPSPSDGEIVLEGADGRRYMLFSHEIERVTS